ncbi:MAG: SUMF1/EgtB/PvdO family nonheme iron enzyme [Chloroflexi bacterium]|nr:SUMF1/EgtB/PvdO family nonheme iron enzyme [Chloroflexota bacterium]
MGADSAQALLPSRHLPTKLLLPAYRLGKYPVTNEQYAEFIRQTTHPVAREMGWFGRNPPKERLNHPVVGVSWLDALAYYNGPTAQTGRGYRLPSEAEWEKAARGTEARLYPWGNAWADDQCHHSQNATAPVDAYPDGASSYGCHDMLGNSSEWTSTLWGADPVQAHYIYPYQVDERENAAASGHRLYRGGSFRDGPDRLRCTARQWYAPDHHDKRRGFRVAMG